MASSTAVVSMFGARFSYNKPSSSIASVEGFSRGIRSSSTTGRVQVGVIRAEAIINPEIRKDEPKVVDSVLVSELSKPLTAYCRCWRSGTFPLCDGGHVKHNKANGDNVGPLLLKKEKVA